MTEPEHTAQPQMTDLWSASVLALLRTWSLQPDPVSINPERVAVGVTRLENVVQLTDVSIYVTHGKKHEQGLGVIKTSLINERNEILIQQRQGFVSGLWNIKMYIFIYLFCLFQNYNRENQCLFEILLIWNWR